MCHTAVQWNWNPEMYELLPEQVQDSLPIIFPQLSNVEPEPLIPESKLNTSISDRSRHFVGTDRAPLPSHHCQSRFGDDHFCLRSNPSSTCVGLASKSPRSSLRGGTPGTAVNYRHSSDMEKPEPQDPRVPYLLGQRTGINPSVLGSAIPGMSVNCRELTPLDISMPDAQVDLSRR